MSLGDYYTKDGRSILSFYRAKSNKPIQGFPLTLPLIHLGMDDGSRYNSSLAQQVPNHAHPGILGQPSIPYR